MPPIILFLCRSIIVLFLLFLISCTKYNNPSPETESGLPAGYESLFAEVHTFVKAGEFRRADSLLAVISDTKTDVAADKIAIWAAIQDGEIRQVLRQSGRGIKGIEAILPLIKVSGTIKQSIRARILLSNFYMMEGRTNESLNLINLCIEEAEYIGDPDLLMSALSSKALTLTSVYDIPGSLETYFKALAVYDTAGSNPSHLAIMLNNIALNYHKAGQYEEALVHYSKAYDINRSENNVSELGANLNNIANSLSELKRYQEASDSLLRAIELDKNQGMTTKMIRYYYNLGNIFLNSGRYPDAETYFNSAYEASTEMKFTPGIMYTSSGLARLNRKLNEPEKAYEMANLAKDLSLITDTFEILVDMWEILSWANELGGKMAAALDAYKEFHSWSDSLWVLTNAREIEEVRTRNEASLTDSENKMLRQELEYREGISRKQVQLLLILSVGVLITGILLFIAVSSRRKLNTAYKTLSDQTDEISRKNKQLEQLNRDNDTLVSLIVHDLRNPLAGLLGALELARSSIPRDDENGDLLKMAHDLANRLKSQIDQLLEVTSIDKKNITPDFKAFSIARIVENVLGHYYHIADKKLICIDQDLIPLQIHTHEEYLIRILDNLVSNAIKYSPRESRVFIGISFIGATYWQLEVRDEGPGFNDYDKDNLFKLFGKLSSKPTGDEESTGLGLYTVKMLVDKLNGTISLESEPGCGARFICRFPGVLQGQPAETEYSGVL